MKENLNRLITSNQTLANTNAELAQVNKEAMSIAKMNQEQREDLLTVCLQIYEALIHKGKRNLNEEVWYRGLKEVLINK